MKDDILTEQLTISYGPTWRVIDNPGLGIDVDGEKILLIQEEYIRDGQYLPYRLNREHGVKNY